MREKDSQGNVSYILSLLLFTWWLFTKDIEVHSMRDPSLLSNFYYSISLASFWAEVLLAFSLARTELKSSLSLVLKSKVLN